MIPIDSESILTFPLKASEPSSPAKPNFPLINFYDLLKSKTLSGSSMSTTDDFSIRTDDDTTKSLMGFESLAGKSTKRKSKKTKIPESQQTLKQIVSKRGDSKIIKCVDDLSPKSNNKKRIMDIEHLENEEQMIKKRMLESGQEIKPINMKSEDSFDLPQIVIKDGKVQVSEPNHKIEDVTKKAVELVTIQQKRVTSSSFKKSNQAEKWAVKETRKFYRGLELFGTDFSMIARLFQNRNRNQIKNKFLKEEKINPEKVEATFKKANTINFAALKRRLEKKAGRIPSRKASVESIIQRTSRSGSFHSVTSLDSIDMSIMEDLKDAFVPTKQLTLFPSFGEQRVSNLV